MAIAIRNHIHLDFPENVTGSPQNAPVREWRTIERMEIPGVIMSIERSLTGKAIHNILHVNGNPVQFSDMRYVVKCGDDGYGTRWENLTYLKSMNGYRVSLVDHIHEENNGDHSSQIRSMILNLSEVPQFDNALQVFYVPIYLTDDDTV